MLNENVIYYIVVLFSSQVNFLTDY